MGVVKSLITTIAPIFLVTSPITSYADQIYSIHRTRSSAGFSLDIPLIMLVASILKVFYWLGARYDLSLLLQACIMIVIQLLLLHVALTNRSSAAGSTILQTPFTDTDRSIRPYNFWQWRPPRPYWTFLLYFTLSAAVLTLLFGPSNILWTSVLGYVALTIEATLPLPQIMSNARNRSCKGFRVSVLANWLLGDAMKMCFFFLADSTITWAFKLCGLFQAACDLYLGVQYWRFGSGG